MNNRSMLGEDKIQKEVDALIKTYQDIGLNVEIRNVYCDECNACANYIYCIQTLTESMMRHLIVSSVISY